MTLTFQTDIITRELVLQLCNFNINDVNYINITKPNSTICNDALRDCPITYITNGQNISSIGDYAFYNISNAYCSFPNCTHVGKYAFANSAIQGVSLGSNVVLESHAFDHCTNLTYIGNGVGISYIGDYAFYNISNADKVEFYFPNCTHVGKYAFANSVIKSLVLGLDVVLESHALDNCKLTSCSLIPSIIGDYAFANFKYKQINFNNVIQIGNYAFDGCENFPAKISLNNCTEIGRYAFRGCENLESLIAPNCTFVDYNAFYGTKLWNVEPS